MNAQQQNRSIAQSGVQNFILQYGDALELTDQQKSELLTLQIDRRSAMQSERQRGRMGQEQRGALAQQRGVRGQQRGSMRSDSDSERRDRSIRADRRSEHRDAILDILTDDQKTKFYELRAERIENRTEVLRLRNRTLVESTISDDSKAEEVLGMLNRITDIQKENQLDRIENAGEMDREKMVENVTEIRSIQDELMSMITVTEYRALRPALVAGQQRQRPGGRGVQRNR